MRGCQGSFQRPGQQVKINRNKQTAKKNPSGKISSYEHKPHDTGDNEQDPVCADDKSQYSLLNFHLYNFRALFMTRAMFLKPAAMPNARKIRVNQGDVSNLRSSTTPIARPIKIESETEMPRLL